MGLWLVCERCINDHGMQETYRMETEVSDDAAYYEYLQRHVNDPRRVRDIDGGYTSVDETHRPLLWDGPTWEPTDGTLEVRPGTPCAESGSHLFVSGTCADCGLVY